MKSITYQSPSLSTYDVWNFGKGEGPSIVITAGIHGVEQTAIYVAEQLIDYFNNHEPSGSVKIIPVCNKAAYFDRSRTSPYDQLDLNRIFPGDKDGSQSMQLAHALWQSTEGADYLIDLHCCGQHGSNYVMSLYSEYEQQQPLALALGIQNVIHSGGAAGQLFLEACKRGQQALLVELKGGQPNGMVDFEAAALCESRLLQFMSQKGVIHDDSEAANDDVTVCFHKKMTTLKSDRHAFFKAMMSSGTHCKKGDTLGMLDNKRIQAPFDGYIAAINYSRYCFAGERMVRIAENNTER